MNASEIREALTHFKTVRIDDIKMAYQELGSGEPLLMIMGYAFSMESWNRELLQLLGSSNRVIIFDNRGMGHSESSDKEYSIPLFAADTLQLVDALKISEANVLGYSMGTYIAQEIALQHPERVKKLLLLVGGNGGKEAIPPTPQGMDALTNSSGTPEEQMKRVLAALFPANWLRQHPNVSEYYPLDQTANAPDRIERQFQAMMKWAGTSSRLLNVTLPTLIIAGDEDILVPAENSLRLSQLIARSWLIRIRNCGHGAMYQYPKLIADQISLFLREAP